MAKFDEELITAAALLVAKSDGQRGKLPAARVRRSISTSYYALFHFLLDEVGLRVIGTGARLARRRRVLARTLSHRGIKVTLEKIRTGAPNTSIDDFIADPNAAAGPPIVPVFAQRLAAAFIDAQAKRNDADYDLNVFLSEADARRLQQRVARVIADWRAANTQSDRDFKHAVCVLMLLKGQLRNDG